MTMTTRKRHSPEQVVRKLVTADRMLVEGKDIADVCRALQCDFHSGTFSMGINLD
jgi:putative transposase